MGIFQELHCSRFEKSVIIPGYSGKNSRLDILFVLNDIFSNLQPQLLSQCLVVLGHIGIDLGQFQIALFECQVDAVLPKTHLGIYMHARLRSSRSLA